MGISEAQALALEVEKNANEKTNLEQVPAQVEKIKSIFTSACTELQNELTLL